MTIAFPAGISVQTKWVASDVDHSTTIVASKLSYDFCFQVSNEIGAIARCQYR